MFDLVSKRMVSFFLNYNAIKQEDEEVYLYGIELILSTITSCMITFLITLLFSKWYLFFVFFVLFIPLRTFAGGYHADTYGKCFLVTVFVYTIYIALLNLNLSFNLYFAALILLLSNLIIFIFTPIIHENNVKTKEIVNKRRFYSRLLIILYSLMLIFLILIKADAIILNAVLITLSTIDISIIANIIGERRKFR